jgi:DNA-binding CsgD family transcriptional regulator
MMRANARAALPRGATAQSDLGSGLRCDRAAEEMLKSFWDGAGDGAVMPPELRGLAEAAQAGPPGVRRSLLMEHSGERLRIEVTAVGRGRTQFHLWRESLQGPVHVIDAVDPQARSDGLTHREREVALLVADGLRSREVAERLDIAPQTVKSHLKTIFDKLGVRNRVELAKRLSLR